MQIVPNGTALNAYNAVLDPHSTASEYVLSSTLTVNRMILFQDYVNHAMLDMLYLAITVL
jgi:hypothetical protein